MSARKHGTVLVVEDDGAIRLLLRRILEAEGYEVAEAADGAGALLAAAERRPDAALLDVGLPGEDGLAVLERFKASPALASVPVVMVTAWGDPERVERAARAGAAGYLRKPFDAGEVVACLQAALGGDAG